MVLGYILEFKINLIILAVGFQIYLDVLQYVVNISHTNFINLHFN